MRILIVEDEPDLLRALAQALREEGYAVDTATDGDDALFKAENWEYDSVVLDIMLPKLDGWEVARRLKADPMTRAIPVIAVSGHAQPEHRRRAVEAGVDEYCVKPCTPGDLGAMIERHLR